VGGFFEGGQGTQCGVAGGGVKENFSRRRGKENGSLIGQLPEKLRKKH